MLEPEAGTDEAYESVVLAPRRTEMAIQLGFWQIGRNLSATLSRQMLAKDKAGKIYKYKKRKHRASAPGQTAANRSGRMRKARTFKIKGFRELEFGIAGAPYAAFLEKGTSKMEPRPGLKNTIDEETKNTENEFLRSLERQLT